MSEKAANKIFQGTSSEELQFPAENLSWKIFSRKSYNCHGASCQRKKTQQKELPALCEGAWYACIPKTSAGMLQGEQLGSSGLLFPNQSSQLDQCAPQSICRPNDRLHQWNPVACSAAVPSLFSQGQGKCQGYHNDLLQAVSQVQKFDSELNIHVQLAMSIVLETIRQSPHKDPSQGEVPLLPLTFCSSRGWEVPSRRFSVECFTREVSHSWHSSPKDSGDFTAASSCLPAQTWSSSYPEAFLRRHTGTGNGGRVEGKLQKSSAALVLSSMLRLTLPSYLAGVKSSSVSDWTVEKYKAC